MIAILNGIIFALFSTLIDKFGKMPYAWAKWISVFFSVGIIGITLFIIMVAFALTAAADLEAPPDTPK